MAKYNGHANWTQWNIALWVNNDEGLYKMAKRFCRRYDRNEAARHMLEALHDMELSTTPDGAKYSVTALKKAFVGI